MSDLIAKVYAEVVNCERCDPVSCSMMLRDKAENVPQPGFVGTNYWNKRVLLMGQNPGIPTNAVDQEKDREYTAFLRDVALHPCDAAYESLHNVTRSFLPAWYVSQVHFPLQESGLALDDIAYCNAVRCRTALKQGSYAVPGKRMRENCLDHTKRILELLQPKVVAFIGKAPSDWVGPLLDQLEIPWDFVNRARHLNKGERSKNRQVVANTISSALGSSGGGLWD